jgi:hypothetical protein
MRFGVVNRRIGRVRMLNYILYLGVKRSSDSSECQWCKQPPWSLGLDSRCDGVMFIVPYVSERCKFESGKVGETVQSRQEEQLGERRLN